MKKSFIAFFCMLCIFLLVTACTVPAGWGDAPSDAGDGSRIPVSENQPLSEAPSSSSMQGHSAPPAISDAEPPLTEWAKNCAAPDFLTEEQQLLSRKAMACSGFLFISSSAVVYGFPLLPGQTQQNALEPCAPPAEGAIQHAQYYYASGRYQNWADFEAMMLGVFTPEYFEALCTSGYGTRFFNADGRLAFADGDRGSNIDLSGVPDTFEVVRESETEITFNVIGHYVDGIRQGESADDFAARRKTSYDYTESFPNRMVNTEKGWRIAEFSITR